MVPEGDVGPGHLFLKCDTITSPPLTLPAQVSPGPATVSVVGGRHYQIKLPTPSAKKPDQLSPSDSTFARDLLDATYFQAIGPTSFICSSCSLPLVRASQLHRYRDLPSEHWAELVDAWMCHADQKLHEHVQKGSKEGFWPGAGEALVGGSYVLIREDSIVKVNLSDAETQSKSSVSPATLTTQSLYIIYGCIRRPALGYTYPWPLHAIRVFCSGVISKPSLVLF